MHCIQCIALHALAFKDLNEQSKKALFSVFFHALLTPKGRLTLCARKRRLAVYLGP